MINSLRTVLLTEFSAETIARSIFVGLQSHPALVSELISFMHEIDMVFIQRKSVVRLLLNTSL